MQVRQFVAVSTVVDFLGFEELLHGSCHLGHVCHEGISLVVGQFVQVVDVVFVRHQTTSVIRLFFEEERLADA